MAFQTLPGGPILFIRLRDATQATLFETLCRDVVRATEDATTEAEALDRTIGRTFRWHRLLRGGRLDALSPEEQKGLVGELRVLDWLIFNIGAQAALTAWTGPSGAPKDFEFARDLIEVKARRAAAQPYVKISNEHQLASVPGRRLWLAVLAVDRVQPPHGATLTEVVEELGGRILASAPGAMLDWELHLADAGFDPVHDYSPWRWINSEPEFHAVLDAFPRIATPVPVGVSSVTYALALSAIAPFATPVAEVAAQLFEEQADG